MEFKICASCLENKSIIEFGNRSLNKDKLQSYCRKCYADKQKEYLRNNPEAKKRAYERTRLWRLNNKEMNNATVQNWKDNNPIKHQLSAIRRNAKRANVPFNLTEDDIIVPEICPVLKIKLEKSKLCAEDYSPSIDRIIPELGYTKGNIQIISFLANKMKNSANFKELRLFAEWVIENIPKEQNEEK